MTHRMHDFLIALGTYQKFDGYFLENWDPYAYLLFSTDHSDRTVDIYACESPVGSKMRLKENCREHDVLRLIAALGISRFPDATREAYFDQIRILRQS